jgi:hypothetical protein
MIMYHIYLIFSDSLKLWIQVMSHCGRCRQARIRVTRIIESESEASTESTVTVHRALAARVQPEPGPLRRPPAGRARPPAGPGAGREPELPLGTAATVRRPPRRRPAAAASGRVFLALTVNGRRRRE